MNILIIDDIKTVGESAVRILTKLEKDVCFFHYDVEKSVDDNISSICDIITAKKISLIAFDRGYSKIYESTIKSDKFIYSSIKEAHRGIKIKAEDILLGKSNLYKGILDCLNTDALTNLEQILLYTYDKGSSEIDSKLEKIEEDVVNYLKKLNLPKVGFQCYETCTVFNKQDYRSIFQL
jgi:hypothetical protein